MPITVTHAAVFAVMVLTALPGLEGSQSAQTDLTITTRESVGTRESALSTTVLHVSGSLRRLDRIDSQGDASQVTIEQCDARRTLLLFPRARTYWSEPRPSREERRDRAARAVSPLPAASMGGPLVTVTIETKDTGERRDVSGLVARRVVTTETVAPSAGAMTPASVAVTDGWYLDVGAACPDDLDTGLGFLSFGMSAMPGRPMDRMVIERRGRPEGGHAIEVTRTDSLFPPGVGMRTTLVSVTRSRLDPRVFEVPSDYRPALPLPGGGVDSERPDTAANRIRSYVEWVAGWAASWFY